MVLRHAFAHIKETCVLSDHDSTATSLKSCPYTRCNDRVLFLPNFHSDIHLMWQEMRLVRPSNFFSSFIVDSILVLKGPQQPWFRFPMIVQAHLIGYCCENPPCCVLDVFWCTRIVLSCNLSCCFSFVAADQSCKQPFNSFVHQLKCSYLPQVLLLSYHSLSTRDIVELEKSRILAVPEMLEPGLHASVIMSSIK